MKKGADSTSCLVRCLNMSVSEYLRILTQQKQCNRRTDRQACGDSRTLCGRNVSNWWTSCAAGGSIVLERLQGAVVRVFWSHYRLRILEVVLPRGAISRRSRLHSCIDHPPPYCCDTLGDFFLCHRDNEDQMANVRTASLWCRGKRANPLLGTQLSSALWQTLT